MKHQVTIPLRGNRNYVQANSLFDSIVSLRLDQGGKALKDIDFFMRRFTDKKCSLVLSGNEPVNDEDIIGEYRDSIGGITILEQGETIHERIAYDESGILNQCKIRENVITIPCGIPSYSFSEQIIAAYKVLLQKLFGKSGHFFFFIRFTLTHIPSDEVQITYDRLISKKYYQGSIIANHSHIGSIYYGVNTL